MNNGQGRWIYSILSVLFLSLCVYPSAHAALIVGNIYDYGLEPARDVEVSINSTPIQTVVARTGMYQLRVEPGSYVITATQQDTEASTEHALVVAKDGTYTVDLILLPSITQEEIPDEQFSLDTPSTIPFILILLVIAVILVLIIAVILFIFLHRERKHIEMQRVALQEYRQQITPEHAERKLTYIKAHVDEHQEVVRIQPKQTVTPTERPQFVVSKDKEQSDTELIKQFIRTHSPTTQKEIRQAFPHLSEAKVSTIISELENDGHARKIKRGRGNIVKESTVQEYNTLQEN